MKERLGWVSNSSSSSFILYGKEVSFIDVENLLKQDKNISALMVLNHCENGMNLIHIDEDCMKFINEHEDIKLDLEFYEYTDYNINCDDNYSLNISNYNKDYSIYNFLIDQHIINNVKQLEHRYNDYFNIKK